VFFFVIHLKQTLDKNNGKFIRNYIIYTDEYVLALPVDVLGTDAADAEDDDELATLTTATMTRAKMTSNKIIAKYLLFSLHIILSLSF
jgi:hypothetical protein